MKIYKYVLEEKSEQEIIIPMNGEIISAINLYDTIAVYVLFDEKEEKTEKTWIKVVCTGETTDDMAGWKFINTVQLYGGKLIFHVFKDITF